MLRQEKERIVAELTERLRASESLIVADYRGLSVSEIDQLRTRLLEAGARLEVVKNTLTRLAAEAAGTTELLQFVEGPTAIAFIQPEGDPVAVAKVLSETARTGRVLVIRGALFEGRPMRDAEVEVLARLPALDVLRGQVLGAVVAPLTSIAALVNAPLQNLVGLIDARIEQLGGEPATGGEEAVGEQTAELQPSATPEESLAANETSADEATAGQAEAETQSPEVADAPSVDAEEEE